MSQRSLASTRSAVRQGACAAAALHSVVSVQASADGVHCNRWILHLLTLETAGLWDVSSVRTALFAAAEKAGVEAGDMMMEWVRKLGHWRERLHLRLAAVPEGAGSPAADKVACLHTTRCFEGIARHAQEVACGVKRQTFVPGERRRALEKRQRTLQLVSRATSSGRTLARAQGSAQADAEQRLTASQAVAVAQTSMARKMADRADVRLASTWRRTSEAEDDFILKEALREGVGFRMYWAQTSLCGWSSRVARSGEPVAGLQGYCPHCRTRSVPGTCAHCGGWACGNSECLRCMDSAGCKGGCGKGKCSQGVGTASVGTGEPCLGTGELLTDGKERAFNKASGLLAMDGGTAHYFCGSCGQGMPIRCSRICPRCRVPGSGISSEDAAALRAVWKAGSQLTGGAPLAGMCQADGQFLEMSFTSPMRDGECARDWMELLDVLEPAVQQSFSQKMVSVRQVHLPWKDRVYHDRLFEQAGIWRLAAEGHVFALSANVLDRRLRSAIIALLPGVGCHEVMGVDGREDFTLTDAQRDGLVAGCVRGYVLPGEILPCATAPGHWYFFNAHGPLMVRSASVEELARIFRSARAARLAEVGSVSECWKWMSASADGVCARQCFAWALSHGAGAHLGTRHANGRRAVVNYSAAGASVQDGLGEALCMALEEWGLRGHPRVVAERSWERQEKLQQVNPFELVFTDALGVQAAFEAPVCQVKYISLCCSAVSDATHGLGSQQRKLHKMRLVRHHWLCLSGDMAGRPLSELPHMLAVENGVGLTEGDQAAFEAMRGCLLSLPYVWSGRVMSPADGLFGVHRRERWYAAAVRRDLFVCCGKAGCGCEKVFGLGTGEQLGGTRQ